MNRFNLLFVGILLIASLPGAGVPTQGPQFQEWKRNLRARAVLLSHETPYAYRQAQKSFIEAIQQGNLLELNRFLKHTSEKQRECALGHSYFLSKGPTILRSALQIAVMFGQTEVVTQLLDFAASRPDLGNIILGLDSAGQSPLHMAIFLDEAPITLEFLKFERRNPLFSPLSSHPNTKGESPKNLAERYQRFNILEQMEMPPEQPAPTNVDLPETGHRSSSTLLAVPAVISVVFVYFLITRSSSEP